jgi:hypothetical protein
MFFLLRWHGPIAKTGAPDDLRLIVVVFRLLEGTLPKLEYDR